MLIEAIGADWCPLILLMLIFGVLLFFGGPTDNANRAIEGSVAMQVVPPGGQICN